MEKIEKIDDYEVTEDYLTMEGFEIITTAQRIRLIIGKGKSCCERWGYFWCNDDPQDFIGANVINVTLTDTALNQVFMTDRALEKQFDGGVMFVNIETDKGTLQFVAYNAHNGYYGHQAKVLCTQLTHAESL